jgi:hypothetical protein
MSEEKPMTEAQPVEKTLEKNTAAGRRGSRSLFAPVVLIAAGVLFLLDNLGVIAGLDWAAAFRFWPLLLIFLGLNVLVTQLRPPLGSLLSLLVALAAVGVFGYLLVRGAPAETMARFGLPASGELQDEPFAVPAEGIESAEITVELGNYAAEIGAGEGDWLATGTIWTRNGLALDSNNEDGRAEVRVGEAPGGFFFNPAELAGHMRTWTIDLSPDIPIDLQINAGNGTSTADLSELTLAGLRIDGGNGLLTATLPDGDYDIHLESSNGGLTVTLPGAGRQEVTLDGGNGGIRLYLPEGVEARVEYDEGNGSVNVDGRFERVSGDDEEGVYETAGYDGGGIVMAIESGNGGVNIAAP